jgi:hypothetical protein
MAILHFVLSPCTWPMLLTWRILLSRSSERVPSCEFTPTNKLWKHSWAYRLRFRQFIDFSLHMILVNTWNRSFSSSKKSLSLDRAFWFCFVRKSKNSLVSISVFASVTKILNISCTCRKLRVIDRELMTINSTKLKKTLMWSSWEMLLFEEAEDV